MKALTVSVIVTAGMIGMSGCATYGGPAVSAGAVNRVMRYEVGTIRSIRYVVVDDNSAVGTLLGAAAGAALGHMVGKGRGRTLATVGGGLAGAYVGSQMAKANAQELTIRLDRGRTIVVVRKGMEFYPGERVRVVYSGNRVGNIEPL